MILSDIGGGLGARHGLFCEVNNTQSDVLLNDVYWAFPNNSQIVHPPPTNSDQYGNGSCYLDYIDRCTSLYYDGAPTERGQFHCVLEWNSSPPPQPIEYEMVPVHIVDLTTFNVTGPHGHVYAGEDITLSVGVSVDPDNTPIPYQWQLNGDDLSDSDRYKGTNTARLRIINIQDENKGEYRVSVAHSESRFSSNVTISVGKCDSNYHLLPAGPYVNSEFR